MRNELGLKPDVNDPMVRILLAPHLRWMRDSGLHLSPDMLSIAGEDNEEMREFRGQQLQDRIRAKEAKLEEITVEGLVADWDSVKDRFAGRDDFLYELTVSQLAGWCVHNARCAGKSDPQLAAIRFAKDALVLSLHRDHWTAWRNVLNILGQAK